ncbi:MAG: O-antigen ligase family protein [Ignavibacteriales bacterium]|nr:O-antigen ligase family protein [Ignavibacteriales bacterium]
MANRLYLEIKHFTGRNFNWLFSFFIISVIARKFISEIQFLYYFAPILLLLFIISGWQDLMQNRSIKILTIFFIIYIIWTAITAFWSDHPLYSLVRSAYLLYLIVGIACAISLWSNNKSFSKKPFSFLLTANTLILILSTISLGLNWPEDAWSGGNKHGFMGVFNVQLAFGRALLILFPSSFFNFLIIFKKGNNQYKFFDKQNLTKAIPYFSIIVLNILFLVLSYSRAALLSLSLIILLTFSFILTLKQNLLLFGVLIIVALSIIQIPHLKDRFMEFAVKDSGSITANRDILWGPSIEAAKIGGIFGIGFGTSTKGIETIYKTIDESGRLRREKGNSILALVEEVGVIGLFLFSIPIVYILFNFFKAKFFTDLRIIISFSMIIGLLIHAQFEDWVVGLSGFTLVLFLIFCYLLLSFIEQKRLT